MKNIDLTFGIPMYNAEKYIGELLKCFKNTNSINYEIIIINDGSTDNSLKICNKFSDLNLRIISQKNLGVSAARNKIIEYANGKWITFIDADDLIDFKSFLGVFNELNKSVAYDYSINTFSRKKYNKIVKMKKDEAIAYMIEKEILNSPWAKFFKTSVLKKYSLHFNDKYSLGEDLLFNYMYINNINNIMYSNEKYYEFRVVNNNSLTHKYNPNKLRELMNINDECMKINKNKSIKVDKALAFIRVKNYISYISDEINQNKNNCDEIIKEIKKENKRKFYILNTLFATIIYNAWFILPNKTIVLIIKKFKRRR